MTKRDFPPIHPGEILLEDFLKPMQISEDHLAQAIGVPPHRINEIVHGKRGITADRALRLGRFFAMEAQFWITSKRGTISKPRVRPSLTDWIRKSMSMWLNKHPGWRSG